MEQTEAEVRHFRHEEEIRRLKEQVAHLNRMNKIRWVVAPIVVLCVGFFWQKYLEPRDFMRFGEEPHTDVTSNGVFSQAGPSTYLELANNPSPGLALRDGPNAYRISVVRDKLVVESTDRNGKAIVKVLLDNGDADR